MFEPTLEHLVQQLTGSPRVFISAPWIALTRVDSLVRHLRVDCDIEIWLRLNPSETGRDEMVQVLQALAYFTNLRLGRNQNLHWKAYLTDKKGFVGSANFTQRGVPDAVDENSSIEGLLALTKGQLEECWAFQRSLSSKIQALGSAREAKAWWLRQDHTAIVRQSPDEPPDQPEPQLPKPSDRRIR